MENTVQERSAPIMLIILSIIFFLEILLNFSYLLAIATVLILNKITLLP